MKSWLMGVVVLLAVGLQVSLLPSLRPFGVVPNLALVVFILLAIYRPATQALAVTLGAAFALDFYSATTFGLRLSFYALVVLATVALIRLGADFERVDIVLLAVLVGTVGFNLAVLSPVWQAAANNIGEVIRIILTESVLNGVIAWLATPVLVQLFSERPSVIVSPSQRRLHGKV